MPSIPLTQGRCALVDDDDFFFLSQFRWCYSNKGYAVHYTRINGQRKVLYMHRLIMSAPPQLQVDHINRNRLDNRRDNLRFATRSQNQANKGLQINNTSGYKGVNWRAGRWDARIKVNNQKVHLGRFNNPLQAALMYDAAARHFFADFATLNFPDKPTPPLIQERFAAVLARRCAL